MTAVTALRTWLAKRSSFELAVGVSYAARAFAGVLVAMPLVRSVGQSGVTVLGDGERVLFRPGGLHLLELVRDHGPSLTAAFQTSLVLAALALAVLTLPSALLFTTAEPSPTSEGGFGSALRRALELAPRFVWLGLLELVSHAVVVFIAAFVFTLWVSGAPAWPTSLARDVVAGSVVGLAALVTVATVAIAFDVARARLARDDTRVLSALKAALRAVRRDFRALFAGYVFFAGVSALLVALAARVSAMARVEEPGAMRVIAVVLAHQATLVGLVILHAAWVRRICRRHEP